jgi:hypothetical protein
LSVDHGGNLVDPSKCHHYIDVPQTEPVLVWCNLPSQSGCCVQKGDDKLNVQTKKYVRDLQRKTIYWLGKLYQTNTSSDCKKPGQRRHLMTSPRFPL